MTDPRVLRLEPGRPDIDLGLRARVAEPVWFLARQWQLGELQGEDASTPVVVNTTIRHQTLAYDSDRTGPGTDPTIVPAEALVEAEPGDWWTIGRRVRLGRAVADDLTAAQRADARFGTLPSPYEALADEVDGAEVHRRDLLPDHSAWDEVPADLPDRWSSSELHFSAAFRAGEQGLLAREHTGGDVDWFTVDADPEPVVEADPPDADVPTPVIPGRLDYPGAPNPRWWQLEDRAVDIGGFAPDRSHLGTMLLLDVVLAHADDWFGFAVPPPTASQAGVPDPPSSGVLISIGTTEVTDSFDQVWSLSPPAVEGPGAWSLFHTTGLGVGELVVWPVAVAPLAGPPLDDVLVGVDEDANLAWAVELQAAGRRLLPDAGTEVAVGETTRTGTRAFTYQPSTTLPHHWHPYQRMRDGDADPSGTVATNPVAGPVGDGRSGGWRQAVMADLTAPDLAEAVADPARWHEVLRPGPVSSLIGGPSGEGVGAGAPADWIGAGHELTAGAIPSSGVRLSRRAMLARDTAGRPVLWVERRAMPIGGPPTSHLRFDVLVEAPPP